MCCMCFVFFFKQKTAYEMRISDWSSDVCSSDLLLEHALAMDDDAFERLIETGEHDPEVLKKCIRAGCVSGKLVPVLCGSSYKNKGVQQLLDAVVDYMPYPGENGGISIVDEEIGRANV